MQRFELEQGTREWHDWRHHRVCSSDIPAIMGVSPHSTAYEHWMVRAGKSPPPSGPQLKAGHAREEGMRQYANERTGLNFSPACIGSDCCRFGASLDGLARNGRAILECKYVNADIFAAAKGGVNPPHFLHQVQWSMSVSQTQLCYLVYENSDGERLMLLVEPELEMQLLQREKAEAWLSSLVAREAPEKTDEDVFEIELPASIEIPYLRACAAEKFWKEEAATYKKEIEKLLTKPKMRSTLLVAQTVTSRGPIKWESVARNLSEALFLDDHEFNDLAERHRSGDRTHVRITKR